jgi:hypothetical protein
MVVNSQIFQGWLFNAATPNHPFTILLMSSGVMLAFLEANAADQLQPEYAYRVTTSIDSQTRYPNWKEALEFCYWMRSQGFDTYAKLTLNSTESSMIVSLWIADPTMNDRAADKLYWHQNTKTGDIREMSFPPQRGSRRNALAVRDSRMPRHFTSLRDRSPTLEHVHQGEDVTERAEEPSPAEMVQAQRLAERVALQEELDDLLNVADPDETYVIFNPFTTTSRILHCNC